MNSRRRTPLRTRPILPPTAARTVFTGMRWIAAPRPIPRPAPKNLRAMQTPPILHKPENQLTLIAKVEAFAGGALLGREEKSHYHQFKVKAADAKALIRFLRDDPGLGFSFFID